MADVITPDALGDAIVEMVHEYTDEVEAGVKDALEETAKGALKELKAASPRETGSYLKGWSIRRRTRDGFRALAIHNATDYQLTHLLEFGHAKTGGGRVAARPHIAAVAERNGAKLTAKLKVVVSGR